MSIASLPASGRSSSACTSGVRSRDLCISLVTASTCAIPHVRGWTMNQSRSDWMQQRLHGRAHARTMTHPAVPQCDKTARTFGSSKRERRRASFLARPRASAKEPGAEPRRQRRSSVRCCTRQSRSMARFVSLSASTAYASQHAPSISGHCLSASCTRALSICDVAHEGLSATARLASASAGAYCCSSSRHPARFAYIK